MMRNLMFVSFTILLSAQVFAKAKVKNYHRIDETDSFVRFVVNKAKSKAFVFVDDDAYAGGHAMRFIANLDTSWPLVEGQIIPVKWHVGSTSGDCYFDSTIEVTKLGHYHESSEVKYLHTTYTIPAYVSAACASQGTRTLERVYKLRK